MSQKALFDQRSIKCGDGWFDLCDRMSSDCEDQIDTLIEQGVPMEGWPRISQITEKPAACVFPCNADDRMTCGCRYCGLNKKKVFTSVSVVAPWGNEPHEGLSRRTCCEKYAATNQAVRRNWSV